MAFLSLDKVIRFVMGEPVSSETTTFVYDEGKLVLSDEERQIKTEERRSFSKRQLAEDEYWMLIPDAIREREYPMFQTIRQYVLDKVKEYLILKSEEAKTANYSSASKEFVYKDLAKDMVNSQVLDRLLSGKSLLKTAPPKSYFHFWYDLVDDGEAICIDVSKSTTKWDSKLQKNVPSGNIRIDGEEWKIIEECEEEEETYIVQWKDTEYIYKLSRMTPEDFERLLHPYQRKMVTKDNYSWKLTRIEKGSK